MGQAIQRQVSAHETYQSPTSAMQNLESWQTSRPELSLSKPQDQFIQPRTTADLSPSITLTPALTRESIQSLDLGLDNLHAVPQDDLARELMSLGAGSSIPPSHPLLSFSSEQPPWNPQNITSNPTQFGQSAPVFITGKQQAIIRPQNNYHGWRTSTLSEGGNHPAPHNPLFDRHHHQRGTRSVISGSENWDGPPDYASGCGDLADITNHWTLAPALSQSLAPYSSDHHSDILSSTHPPSTIGSQQGRPYPSRQIYQKPKRIHMCDVADCDRTEGFTSANDLDRHKKAKHGIAPRNGKDKSYKCAATGCKHPDKVWPRLDNFKNHCKTCHKNENVNDLVKRSEIVNDVPPPDTSTSSTFPQPMQFDTGAFPFGDTSLNQTPVLDSYPLGITMGQEIVPTTLSGEQLAQISNQHIDGSGLNKQTGVWSVDSTTRPNTGIMNDVIFPESPELTTGRTSAADNLIVDDPLQFNMTHTISGAMLDNFVSDLVQDLTGILSLDFNSMENIRAVLKERVHRLTNDAYLMSNLSLTEPYDNATMAIPQDTSTDRGLICPSPGCGKTFNRPCELKKHVLRHSRPWFCTFSDCARQDFGSKADWKRHELTKHFLPEMFTCDEPAVDSSLSRLCSERFSKEAGYVTHLCTAHNIHKDVAQGKAQERKARQPSSYWCGFCRQTFPIEQESEEWSNERFNHIEKHFNAGAGYDAWQHLDKAHNSRDMFTTPAKRSNAGHISISSLSSASTTRSPSSTSGGQQQRLAKRPRDEADDAQIEARDRMYGVHWPRSR